MKINRGPMNTPPPSKPKKSELRNHSLYGPIKKNLVTVKIPLFKLAMRQSLVCSFWVILWILSKKMSQQLKRPQKNTRVQILVQLFFFSFQV